MFCWSCGHENSDHQKFCGECGRSLYKPEKVVENITSAKTFSRANDSQTTDQKPADHPAEAPPKAPRGTYLRPPDGTLLLPPLKQPQTTVVPREPEIPKQTNPLIEEPRVVHEKPLASGVTPAAPVIPPEPPTMIRDRVPNRITGPSFLGLSDEGSSRSDDESYLLDDEPETSSPWRGYLMLALLVVISLLVIRNWGDIRSFAAAKLGGTETAKHPAGPERVTASDDASQMTPDAAPEESKTAAPANSSSDQKDASKPQQTAKLEKPQSDKDSDTASKPEAASKEEEPGKTKPSPSAEASVAKPAAPAYDNSQLEEAQKYLQGRGVPQDCNRGVSLLRSAAAQPNPKARIQMAALYVSGHCVPEDPTQAYNWFSKAQQLEPHNRLIERNLDSLWARMSDEERRKVLR